MLSKLHQNVIDAYLSVSNFIGGTNLHPNLFDIFVIISVCMVYFMLGLVAIDTPLKKSKK